MSEARKIYAPNEYYMWGHENLVGFYNSIHATHRRLARPSFPDETWHRVDTLAERLLAKIERRVAVVLTNEANTGEYVYVFFEPLANVIVTLDHAGKKSGISSDYWLWEDHEAAFSKLISEADQYLQKGEIIECLLFAIQRSHDVLISPPGPSERAIRGNWQN